ncbi:MAG: DNA-binding response regulator [Firmicutes bacterium GWF2_51_9]|nr:MAG: DNA-binding response regulator [Firmicutes bacterium GWF2_51_9]OGS58193.1 MAG: DNA-binding response regulator [Firmicutes bacterium GWE2_51_13]HAO60509.1 DNA-binding response regulator [Erysipelotrichaceae bacterium]HBZ42382.1 DNA-binding response regulator [Erysipelotrichaceae bacterium]
MPMERILIIEDESKIARFIQLELNHEGYEVELASDGRDGLELLKTRPFDLVLLDIMLPSINGFEVLRRLRLFSSVAVILLTAKDDVIDKVMGLDSGADDYITKPFAIEELLARIRMALRKQNRTQVSLLTHKDLVVDVEKYKATLRGKEIELTKKEFDLLTILLQNKNKVCTRENLLERVWGYSYDGTTNAVDVYIRHLRVKIEDEDMSVIHTVRGVGYVIKDE